MAKGKKTGGRDFKPGQSGNPAGKAPTPVDVRDARKENTYEVTRILTKHLAMSREQLAIVVRNPQTTSMELLVAGIILKAITGGDHSRATFIFDRAFGKVPEVHAHGVGQSLHAALVNAMRGIGGDET